PGAIQTLDDQLFVMTTDGVRVYGEGSLISRPIDNVLPLGELFYRNERLRSTTNDAHSEYVLIVEGKGSYVFNTLTSTWALIGAFGNATGAYFDRYAGRMVYGFKDGTI